MKRIILILVSAVYFTACTNTNNKVGSSDSSTSKGAIILSESDKANAPVFKFEKESYDFGQIASGEKVTYDFKFKNVGKTPLIITRATATCGCTVPEYPKDPIAPGNEGAIHVVFNSKGKEGMQNKVISIVSNTVPELTELHLLGDVKKIKKKNL